MALYFSFTKFNHEHKIIEISGSNDCYLFVYGIQTFNKVTKGITDGINQRLVNLSEILTPFNLRPHSQSAYALVDLNLLKYRKLIKNSKFAICDNCLSALFSRTFKFLK